MNSKKHKLPRRILAMLLAICMFVTMFPSAMFAWSGHGGGGSNDPVTITKTATQTGPDEWEVTMTVQASKEIQSEPLELVLLLDRSGSMAWCTHSDKWHDKDYHEDRVGGGRWCEYPGEESRKDSRQAIAGNAAKDLIDDLAKKGISASVSVVGFAGSGKNVTVNNSTEVLQGMEPLTTMNTGTIKDKILTSGASGGTYMDNGLRRANQQFSSGASNKVIILLADGDHDGTDPNDENGYVDDLVRNGVTVYTIGFTTTNDTLYNIAGSTGGTYYTADNADDLADVFTQIAGNLTAMVEDDMGNDVQIVDGTDSVDISGTDSGDNGTVSTADGKLSWNPPDGKLDAGQTATITYTVKLTDYKAENLNVGNNTVNLNGNAVLTYKINGEGQTYTKYFPTPTDNVAVAKLSVSNKVNGEPVEDQYSDQFALVYDKAFWQKNDAGNYVNAPFTWATPDESVNGAEYSNSTLTVPGGSGAVDVNGDDFQSKLTTVTGGEYKLVHEYNSAQEGQLTLEIYVDGNTEPETISSQSDLEKYIKELGTAAGGQTEKVDLSYNEGKVNVGYEYEQYNSADLQFTVNDVYVLQAVDGQFIIGKTQWDGVKNKGGVTTVDNVAGNSTLKIYLHTPYTVAYYPEDTEVTDGNTYIVSAHDVTAPEFPQNPTNEQRSQGYAGGWADTSLLTTVALKAVPDTYIGWYKTNADGSEKHSDRYSYDEIEKIAAVAGANTVIECYAKQKDPGLTVKKSISKVVKADGTKVDGSTVETVAVDDTIYYTVTVKNSGNVALDNINVTDTLTIGKKTEPLKLYTDDNFQTELTQPVSLAADASATYYAKYIVKGGQDGDAGKSLSNTAVAKDGDTEGTGTTDPITVDNPKLTVEKSIVSIDGKTDFVTKNPTAKVGNVIIYKITVKNEGNVALSDISVADTLEKVVKGADSSQILDKFYGDSQLSNEMTEESFSLDPNATKDLYVTYTVQDGDEKLTNTASASNDDVTSNEGQTPDITVETPGLEVTKTIASINGDKPGDKPTASVNDVIIYEITVKNTGNVALRGITVTDTLNGETNLDLYTDADCTELLGNTTINLALNGEQKLYAKHTVSKEDTTLTNVAEAEVPGGPSDEGKSPDITVEHPALTVTKTVVQIGETVIEESDEAQNNLPVAKVGDTIKYKIVVANSGNVDLTGIDVTDELTIGNNEPKPLDLVDKDGNKLDGTIKLNAGEEVTYYATYEVTAEDAGETLTNEAKATANDGTEGGDETPGIETSSLYTLAYDANGGTIGEESYATNTNLNAGSVALWAWTENAEGTFTSTGTLPDGFEPNTSDVPKHADAPAPADTIISDAGESVPVVFIGWTETPTAKDENGKVDQSKIYAAGEELPDLTESVTIGEGGKIVYAVWGYDENGDGIADADQVIVTPADIRIYTGGNGYSDVINDADQEVVDSQVSDGLPTPGYYIILPYDVNEKVLAQAEKDNATVTNSKNEQIADLSDYLTFDYTDSTGKIRHWTLDRYDGTTGNTSMAYDKFIYRINPATTNVEGESVPIRLLFTDAEGNEKISDDFTVSTNTLYQTFDMTIYAGDLDRGLIKANFAESTGVSAQNIGVGSGTLTVRGVVTDEDATVNTTPILEAGADVNAATDVSVQLQNANTNFYINESKLEVANPDAVKLLVDSTVSDESDATMRDMAETQFSDTITEEHSVDMKYLDLVDTSNGNAWVTTGGDEVTVFWPYPADADPNGEFYVVHYEGLDRDEGGALNGYDTRQMTLYSTEETAAAGTKIEKTDNGITFTVDSFSPFAVYYTAKADPDTPDNPGWTPGGSGDEPDGLNTEDHFSYIVGYAEDYRTGEPTDNEDLWPVKPNNQITRAEVATIFYRLLEDEVRDEYDTTVNDFSDVSADSWYNQTVSTLASMEIVKGYEDGSFRPNAPITRAEFGAIATRFFAETGATYVPGTFTDVTGDEWYANAIQDAVNLGLIGGYPDGTVRPNNNITRAEACAIVNRTLGRVPDADHLLPEDVMKVWPDNNPTDWFYADMQEATNGHEYAWIEEDGHEIEEWTNLLDKDWTDR